MSDRKVRAHNDTYTAPFTHNAALQQQEIGKNNN